MRHIKFSELIEISFSNNKEYLFLKCCTLASVGDNLWHLPYRFLSWDGILPWQKGRVRTGHNTRKVAGFVVVSPHTQAPSVLRGVGVSSRRSSMSAGLSALIQEWIFIFCICIKIILGSTYCISTGSASSCAEILIWQLTHFSWKEAKVNTGRVNGCSPRICFGFATQETFLGLLRWTKVKIIIATLEMQNNRTDGSELCSF